MPITDLTIFPGGRALYIADCRIPGDSGQCVIKVMLPDAEELNIIKKFKNLPYIVQHIDYMPENNNPNFCAAVMGRYRHIYTYVN